jgi:hypothetical protein
VRKPKGRKKNNRDATELRAQVIIAVLTAVTGLAELATVILR